MVAIFLWLAFLANSGCSAEYHNYQNGFGMDSQLALPVDEGGGVGRIEVQMTAVDYYTYIRRKELLMPLIADLIRFNNLNNEVTAYVLNVDQQNDYNSTRNETAVVSSVVIDSSVIFNTAAGSAVSTAGSAAGSLLLNNDHNNISHTNDEQDIDLFSQTVDEMFASRNGADGGLAEAEDSLSLMEQNLADLKDYCDISSSGNNNNFNFNNLSFNLIPKDLLEAASTDLFWSRASTSREASWLEDLIRFTDDTEREERSEEDINKYLDFMQINKETEDEDQQGRSTETTPETTNEEEATKLPSLTKPQKDEEDMTKQDWFLNGNLVVVKRNVRGSDLNLDNLTLDDELSPEVNYTFFSDYLYFELIPVVSRFPDKFQCSLATRIDCK